MALDDGGIKAEQHFLEHMPCGAENLSPYSNTSGYSDTPTYYAADYDWQHQEQHQQPHHHQPQPQQQQPQHPNHLTTHHIHESSLRYYGSFTDSLDMSANGYANFTGHNLTQSDYFPNSHALWTVSQPDPISSNNMTPHSRFFSGVDLSQQVASPQSSANTGPNGKPKRKRVQSHSQRKAANVRERRRMFHLNEAFDELRKRLPAFNYEKRLSRIETLRLAMTYISFMKEVSVGRDPKCVKLKPHGADLSSLPLPLNGSSIGLNHASFTDMESPDDGNTLDSDDCSNDVHSLHSA